MALESMSDLLLDQLKDLYSAEQQLVRALPKLAEAACSQSLKEAFEGHLGETEGQVTRLERAFQQLGVKPNGRTCRGMEGLLREGDEMTHESGSESVRDAGLIAAAQRVEHYEIAAYGCAITFARLLGHEEVVSLLEETLSEEKAADDKLTGIADEEVNQAALSAPSTTE
jgi:ferritin-like metal-binding protein YciE